MNDGIGSQRVMCLECGAPEVHAVCPDPGDPPSLCLDCERPSEGCVCELTLRERAEDEAWHAGEADR